MQYVREAVMELDHDRAEADPVMTTHSSNLHLYGSPVCDPLEYSVGIYGRQVQLLFSLACEPPFILINFGQTNKFNAEASQNHPIRYQETPTSIVRNTVKNGYITMCVRWCAVLLQLEVLHTIFKITNITFFDKNYPALQFCTTELANSKRLG